MLFGLLVEDEEHVLPVLAPVAGDFPQRLVVQQRRLDLVEIVTLALANELVELIVDGRSALGPEHAAGRVRMHHEQVERLADDTMVATLRLLDAMEVAIEFILL